jgi:hypothetical protein
MEGAGYEFWQGQVICLHFLPLQDMFNTMLIDEQQRCFRKLQVVWKHSAQSLDINLMELAVLFLY